MLKNAISYPLAITMWDFSWLERRWTGAGYENWNQVLDELKLRGYDAVRIDAYPHLVAADPTREWELIPCWNTQDWGSPGLNRVAVQPHLNQFIESCAERGIRVALSTWFREDADNHRMNIFSPEDLGRIWKATLDTIAEAGLLDNLLYVDLCNEFPLDVWAPFLRDSSFRRASTAGADYMRRAIAPLRTAYPQLDYCFSITSEYETWREEDVSMQDLLELHLWMAQGNNGEFYERVGYHYERFDPKGYENIARCAESLYRSDVPYWQNLLRERIAGAAAWARHTGKPLVTTECWSLVDYKDYPLLHWDWIKDLCELGVREASAAGLWAAVATSNFCGPQFVGMWRDVEWHQRMTDVIHNGKLPF
jgi:hypothetical protein